MINISKKLIRYLSYLIKIYVFRDESTIAHSKWVRDKGDKNLRLDYPLVSTSIVFDLGGYKGDFAKAINDKYSCNVYIFEPVKSFYLECVKRFEGNEKIRCFNYGLLDKNGKFLISNNENGSSVLFDNTSTSCEQVNIKSFDEELENLNIGQIDLLKINIEGSEFLVLPYIISKNVISKIKYIQVQFHNFYPNAKNLRKIIRNELLKTHIEMWNYPFVWESWVRIDGIK